MTDVLDEFEKIKKLNEEKSKSELLGGYNPNQLDFNTTFVNSVTGNNTKTIALEYEEMTSSIKMQVIRHQLGRSSSEVYRFGSSSNAYLSFCEDTLKLDTKKLYNDSSSINFRGTPTRVYSTQKPYKNYPLVVLSMAKQPPDKINTLSQTDEAKLKIAMEGNFIVCGGSGAGKTYLLNYLLSKYVSETKRIGVIQEFLEIFPPNDFTDMLTVPPRDPRQTWNDLNFMVEQSNLQRYDMLILGEIKSVEAFPYVQNAASGTQSIATVHGNSPQNALKRLKSLCLCARPNLEDKDICSLIKDALQYVVYVERQQVKEIKKITMVSPNGTFSLGDVPLNY